jgi:hypothetical protein
MVARLSIALSFALALAWAYLVFALQRPRQDTLHGHLGIAVEVFASDIVSVLIVYLVHFPAMARFGIGVP